MGGVRRHAQEIFPRAAAILKRGGGGLWMLTPRSGLGFPLAGVNLIPSAISTCRVQRILRQGRALSKAAQEAGAIDLIHSAHLPASSPSKIPLVHLQHDLRRKDSVLGRRWLKQALGRARSVIAVSQATADELGRLAAHPNITVIHHGGDHLPRLPRSIPNKPFILVPGHLEPRKDPLTAVRALTHDPLLPTMLFAGAVRGTQAQRMQTEAARLGVLDRVRYAGPIPDNELAELYATCSGVLLPSRLEGFGLPVLETLHAGAPLAVSDIPAHAEIVPPSVPRFSPGDPLACAQALRKALDQGPADHRMRTWDEAAQSLVSAWTCAADKPSAP